MKTTIHFLLMAIFVALTGCTPATTTPPGPGVVQDPAAAELAELDRAMKKLDQVYQNTRGIVAASVTWDAISPDRQSDLKKLDARYKQAKAAYQTAASLSAGQIAVGDMLLVVNQLVPLVGEVAGLSDDEKLLIQIALTTAGVML